VREELEVELEEEEEEEDRKYIVIFFIISLLLLIFIVIGFTYSLYSGSISGNVQPIDPNPTNTPTPSKSPVPSTSPMPSDPVPSEEPTPSTKPSPTPKPTKPTVPQVNVVFNYSDASGSSSGISLKNASAISDVVGKKLMGEGNTFEFSVNGNVVSPKIKYYVLIETDVLSTLPSSDVKVYLTSKTGTGEVELRSDVLTVSELKDIQMNGKNYKVLYEKYIDKNTKFSDDYVLRMWIKENASDYYGKNYILRVDVLAEGVGE